MKRSVDHPESTHDVKRSRNLDDSKLTTDAFHRSSEFNVRPKNFEGNFPYFRQPREISAFSLDEKRIFHHDRSRLRVYAPPSNTRNVSFNLRDGYSIFVKRDETKKEYLDELLRCILGSTGKFQPNTSVTSQDDGNLK